LSAITACQAAARIRRPSGDRQGGGKAPGNVGIALWQAGRYDEAATLGAGMWALRKAERKLTPAQRAALAPSSSISVRPSFGSLAPLYHLQGLACTLSILGRQVTVFDRREGPQGDILTMLKK
jgi:hypothetical protein